MGKAIKRIITGILVVLGIIFILILLMPDDEEDVRSQSVEISEEATDSGEGEEPEGSAPGREENASGREENSSGKEDSAPGWEENSSGKEESTSGKDENSSGGNGKKKPAVDILSVGTDAESATVMIYMNGSDLETEGGEATTDIGEMLSSGIGDNVNVVIQTMGTRTWHDYGISSKTAQTYVIKDNSLNLVRDDLGQLDCTRKETLSEFISYCSTSYPADRYFFVFWDHGGGPVYGFGYDEWQAYDASLTLDEIAGAFEENKDIHFDIIGMDCCIMANLETCCALSPYCKYALLSEDFESELGWSYKEWMKELEEDPGISSPLLGKYIVDSVIEDNETSEYGDSSCLGLFNESTMNKLYSAWKKYAYLNEEALLERNYSKKHMSKGRSSVSKKGFWDLWGLDLSSVTLEDYYISDMLALIESIDSDSDEAKDLISVLKAAVAYYGHTSDANELTGLAVSLPYGDRDFYKRLKKVYGALGFEAEYVEWLGKFVSSKGKDDFFDFGFFENSWGGWGEYEEEYGCSDGNCANSWFYSDDGSESEDFCENENSEYYDYGDEDSNDDWIYDYEEEIWYLFEDGILYLYDDETGTMFYYDEDEDMIYAYDEEEDDWYEAE